MDTKEARASKNCQIFISPLIVLVIAILAVGEVYIAIRMKQLNDKLDSIEHRMDARINQMHTRTDDSLKKLDGNFLNKHY